MYKSIGRDLNKVLFIQVIEHLKTGEDKNHVVEEYVVCVEKRKEKAVNKESD